MDGSLADAVPPPLREDLRLLDAVRERSGEPHWVIQDIVVNKFYKIGWLEFECLTRWGLTPNQMREKIIQQTSLRPDVEQVLDVWTFFERNELLRPDVRSVERLRQASEGIVWLHWRWWLHHYLFFRVPLLHPQNWLKRLAASLSWLFHPLTGWIVLALSVTGIIMVLQQWDQFTHAVVESFSAEGLVSFALAIIVAKTCHELGHALVATRYGLRVAHMGIAFVVLWPMLYTDTSESWKLSNPRHRLAIASAGIITELSIAGLATLGWALSDDGALRNAFLYLATTSWILSLALNASPFMRFDGYFIASDLVDMPNLHQRSSALARTAIRRSLLGLDEDWPEQFPIPKRRLLIAFAMITWVYRLLVFIGIAVAVYFLFFKLLGIFLFMVEISWFIVMPVWRELRHWWANRGALTLNRRRVFGSLVALVLLCLIVPWQSQVSASGVAHGAREFKVFSPFPAQLVSLRPVGTVRAGELLLRLDDPDLGLRMVSSEASMMNSSAQLAGLMGDPRGLSDQTAAQNRLAVQRGELDATRAEIRRLSITAPFDGEWLDVEPDLRQGQWVGNRMVIGVLVDPAHWQVDAYVKANEVSRLHIGDQVRFYADGRFTPMRGTLISIGSTRASRLDYAMLASAHGGPLSTNRQGDTLNLSTALVHVKVELDERPANLRETRGRVQISGERRSLAVTWVTQLASVALRESGF